jgi:hypothetical protein
MLARFAALIYKIIIAILITEYYPQFDRGCGTAYTTCRGEPEIPKEPLQHHPVILIQHLERVRDFGLFLLGAPAQAGGHNVS